MEIVIKNKEVSLKYSFRALMIYENITQKSFNPKGISDVVVFFYTFDDFIDWLDANPTAISEFSVWLTSVFEAQSGLVNKDIKPEETTVDEKN